MKTRWRERGNVASSMIMLVFVAVAGLLYINRDHVADQVSVWQYEPTPEIQELASRSAMSDKGVFYFYSSQPSLEATQKFNTQCDRQEEGSAILGCYASGKIFIYDVPNPRLDGIQEVTAAHEMLHVVYARLDEAAKSRLAPLLEAEYTKIEDSALKERMDYYARTQPGERINELHSIIGTEVNDVSDELEAHYRTYFTDRSVVTALHANYNKVFVDLSNRTDALTERIKVLAASIEVESQQYNSDVRRVNSQIEAFNARANNGDFSSSSEFNQARAEIVRQVDGLRAQRSQIDQNIAIYQELYRELEAIALQTADLNKSIDSSLAPAPQL